MKVYIDYNRCKGDGLCVDLCPVDVFEIKIISQQPRKTKTIVINDEICILCRICEINCPNQAIKITQ
ncbi:MAG: ferredoxin family protein [Candidatus Bathyarchaeota archaeon]|nr:ferredoxin family protein [Candidatus Bathyarchaeota archaeon]MDH5494130.1 ferredoxin family protein [Candidatus Bathyarchaeota archaeon]